MFFYFNVAICLISVFLYVFVYYLIDSFLPFFLCDPFFLPIFIHVPLSWTLSFLLPCPCLFVPPPLSLSFCITKVCPAESAVWLGLPGHPGFNGGRVEFDGQPVRLYLPLLRAAPQAQQAQHRQEGQYNPSHDSLPPFHTSWGFYSLPKCRAAQTLMRKWKLQPSRFCCNFWLLKSPKRIADTLAFPY